MNSQLQYRNHRSVTRFASIILVGIMVSITSCSGLRSAVNDGNPGRTLLENAAMACGGLYTFEDLTTLFRHGTVTVFSNDEMREATVEESRVFPDKRFVSIESSGNFAIEVLNGYSGWTGGSSSDTRPATTDEIRKWRDEYWRDPALILANARSQQTVVRYLGKGVVGSTAAEIIEIRPPGGISAFRLFLDANTMIPLRISYNVQESLKRTEAYIDFLNYEPVGTLRLPHTVVWYHNGIKIQEVRYETIADNVVIEPDIFEMD